MARSKTASWEPAAFSYWYEKLPTEKRQRVWDALKRDQRKVYNEWMTFRSFAKSSPLDIDPRSIEMCDPNSASPPLPDTRCRISGQLEYFELGEVTSEGLARTASIAQRNRVAVYGGGFLQRQPLVRIFLKKCRNRYTTKGNPLHLILYFAVGHQSPFEPQLNYDMERWRMRLVERIRRSPFTSVWLYDDWQKRVLFRLDR